MEKKSTFKCLVTAFCVTNKSDRPLMVQTAIDVQKAWFLTVCVLVDYLRCISPWKQGEAGHLGF